MRCCLRSVPCPSCAVPKGYTRVQCDCGGYEFRPVEGGTFMSYMNIVDPKGSIPAAVVKITVPQRAMLVARVRHLFD